MLTAGAVEPSLLWHFQSGDRMFQYDILIRLLIIEISRGSASEETPLKFAILSDIHGNRWALAAVLEDAKRRGITRFINLGDILYGPLKPLETYDLLKTVDAVTI